MEISGASAQQLPEKERQFSKYLIMVDNLTGGAVRVDTRVLATYLNSRRALYESYAKQAEGKGIHEDIMDPNAAPQYPVSGQLKHECSSVFQYSVKAATYTAKMDRDGRGENGEPLFRLYAEDSNGMQVGFVLFHSLTIEGKPYVYLAELAVDPDHRGLGHASKLIQSVLENAQNIATTFLVLTRSFNDPALSLYQKFGFVSVPGKDGERLVTRCGYDPLRYTALVIENKNM